jgi:hypothetical protein
MIQGRAGSGPDGNEVLFSGKMGHEEIIAG